MTADRAASFAHVGIIGSIDRKESWVFDRPRATTYLVHVARAGIPSRLLPLTNADAIGHTKFSDTDGEKFNLRLHADASTSEPGLTMPSALFTSHTLIACCSSRRSACPRRLARRDPTTRSSPETLPFERALASELSFSLGAAEGIGESLRPLLACCEQLRSTPYRHPLGSDMLFGSSLVFGFDFKV